MYAKLVWIQTDTVRAAVATGIVVSARTSMYVVVASLKNAGEARLPKRSGTSVTPVVEVAFFPVGLRSIPAPR